MEVISRGGHRGASIQGPPGIPSSTSTGLPTPTTVQLAKVHSGIDHGAPPGPTDPNIPTDPTILSTATSTSSITPTTTPNPTISRDNISCSTGNTGLPAKVWPPLTTGDGGQQGEPSTSTNNSKNTEVNNPSICYYKSTFASLNIQGLLTSGRQKKEAVLQFLRSEDIEVLAL